MCEAGSHAPSAQGQWHCRKPPKMQQDDRRAKRPSRKNRFLAAPWVGGICAEKPSNFQSLEQDATNHWNTHSVSNCKLQLPATNLSLASTFCSQVPQLLELDDALFEALQAQNFAGCHESAMSRQVEAIKTSTSTCQSWATSNERVFAPMC